MNAALMNKIVGEGEVEEELGSTHSLIWVHPHPQLPHPLCFPLYEGIEVDLLWVLDGVGMGMYQ